MSTTVVSSYANVAPSTTMRWRKPTVRAFSRMNGDCTMLHAGSSAADATSRTTGPALADHRPAASRPTARGISSDSTTVAVDASQSQ
jgi:hypothetical protein